MKKKLTAVFLSSIIILSAVTSCVPKETASTNSTKPESSNETLTESDGEFVNTLPISNGDVSLLIYNTLPIGARQKYKDYSEHPGIKIMMEQTGINLKFMHVPENDDGTYLTTTIASGVLPDIFMSGDGFKTYPGGLSAAIEDELLINPTELINKYAPNFNAMVASKPEAIKKRIYDDNGVIARFGTIFNPPFIEGVVNYGLFIRQDLLDEYKLPMPITLDDYTNTLQTFKDNGVKTPLALPELKSWGWDQWNIIASAFGVSHSGYFIKDGVATYSRVQPEYKEYLTLLNDWYNKGFFTRDFSTMTEADSQKEFTTGNAGITMGGNWMMNQFNKLGKTTNPNFYAAGSFSPRKSKDDVLTLASQALSVDGRTMLITTACKNPIEAVRFIDYLYLPETQILTAWGPGTEEFPTYTVENGVRKFTDFMLNNPEGDIALTRDMYCLNPFQIQWDEEMEKQQYTEENRESWKTWGFNNNDSDIIPTVITPTIDDSRELARIQTTIDTYAIETISKMIVGEISLDKFDEMVTTINSMELEKATAITQAAYERYMNR